MRFLGSPLLLLEMKRNGTLVYQNTMTLLRKSLAILKKTSMQNQYRKPVAIAKELSAKMSSESVFDNINSNHNSINPFTKQATMVLL